MTTKTIVIYGAVALVSAVAGVGLQQVADARAEQVEEEYFAETEGREATEEERSDFGQRMSGGSGAAHSVASILLLVTSGIGCYLLVSNGRSIPGSKRLLCMVLGAGSGVVALLGLLMSGYALMEPLTEIAQTSGFLSAVVGVANCLGLALTRSSH